ncbi:MAG: hypothetical protein LQ347_006014 [Umbilicaria vellea]|nr:MAG: hypothetical protein LQ347_006014 [Umbilicaria vellea]
MQAISGAGYPGVSSMDILDNVVPFISGEEDKLETEAQKILGSVSKETTSFEHQSGLKISAACNRVAVLDGHTACVSLRFVKRPPPSAQQVKEAMREYVSEAQKLRCPSAPENSLFVFDEDDRPQPRLDRDLQGGYTVSVGRVREDESGIFDIKFVALSHNKHFSTPIHFAQKYFGLGATLIPFPSGTGHMITSLQTNEIDVGIGLTEGWVAAIGKQGEQAGFKIVGTYVETPLCWAISTGARRELKDVSELKDAKIADTRGWLKASGDPPFDVVPLQTFVKLREAVNDRTADFFMWEHFTSKKYYDNGEIKRVGEIYTPWSSWKIVSRDPHDQRLEGMFEKINKGVEYFEKYREEAIEYISTQLDYSADDATEWLKTVKFAENVKGVSEETIEKTVEILRKAGVIEGTDVRAKSMIAAARTT